MICVMWTGGKCVTVSKIHDAEDYAPGWGGEDSSGHRQQRRLHSSPVVCPENSKHRRGFELRDRLRGPRLVSVARVRLPDFRLQPRVPRL